MGRKRRRRRRAIRELTDFALLAVAEIIAYIMGEREGKRHNSRNRHEHHAD